MVQEVYKHYLKGWRAEVGLLAPVAAMYREFDVLAPEGSDSLEHYWGWRRLPLRR